MSQHYNAFISYKHAELDNKIAAQIEKDLEHYHIPRKVQKKTGYERIERIFRDKDELPITSNLSGTIEEALLNSEYLIVLCSKSTCLSTWVEREIKLFLQNHPRENVLTVLAEGEPQDVIPRILQEVEAERTKEDGTTETIMQSVEPLSCDYRIPRREIKSAEVPRLVAALIGCPYDELINRQRQFKMKRLTAIFAMFMTVAVGFGAYMAYSNKKIHDNYLESLRNQSRFLATESSQRLENEERIDALQLAVAALPDENNPERPVVPEAVSALTNATYAYRTKMTSTSIAATWTFTMPDMIVDYNLSPDKTTICAEDISKNFKVWNTETHEEVFHNEADEDTIDFFKYLNDDTVLFAGSDFLKAVDTKSGKTVWEQKPFEGGIISGGDCAVSGDYLYVSSYENGLYKISVKDGKTQEIYEVQADKEARNDLRSFAGMKLSPDGKELVAIDYNNLGHGEYLSFYNLETGELRHISITELIEGYDVSSENVYDITWLNSETVIFAIDDSSNSNSSLWNQSYLSKDHRYIYCISSKDMTVKWNYDFEYSGVIHKSMFELFDDGGQVAYGCANMCRAWNLDTGELTYDLDVTEPVIKVIDSGNGKFICITWRGGWASADQAKGNDALNLSYFFTDELDKVITGRGLWAHKQGSNTIIGYEDGVFDKDISFIEDAVIEDKNSCSTILDGDYAAVLDKEGDDLVVQLYDAAGKKYIGKTVISSEELSERDFDLQGIYDGKVYLTRGNDKVISIIEADCVNDSCTTLLEEYCGSIYCGISYSAGKFVYESASDEDKKIIKMYDIDSKKNQEVVATQYRASSSLGLEFYSKSDLIFMSNYNGDEVLDLKTSKVTSYTHPESWELTDKIVYDPENQIVAMTDKKMIQVYSLEGETLFTIACPDVKPVGISIYAPDNSDAPKMFMVLYDNGQLFRYNYSNGELIGKTALTESTRSISDKNLKFVYDYDQELMIISSQYSLYMVSLENYLRLAQINSSIGYHQDTDTFLCCSLDDNRDYRVGFFKHYSVEDLLAKAGKILEGIEVSEELKNAYGIK